MKQIKRRTAIYALGLFGGLLAVAVWGKMRFVTDLPRMAYAVPEDQEPIADRELGAEGDQNTPQPDPETTAPLPRTSESRAPLSGRQD